MDSEQLKEEGRKKVRAKLVAIADAIRVAGPIPSGHLYALLMSVMSLEEYTILINALKQAKLISESNYLLTYTGPTIEEVK